jgi:hypothetical protein
MQRKLYLLTAILIAAQCVVAQDDGEMRIRRALEGRQVLVKIDMPAIDSGIAMMFDDTNVTYDEANYNRLLKEYGVAAKRGTKARITAVRVTSRGIEIDLDGGGSPGRDWLVGKVRLDQPAALAKSDREVELERMLEHESNSTTLSALRSELEYERQMRVSQDERNRQAFDRMVRMRSEYLKENRKNWGTKLLIVIRSKKEATSMRDLVSSLSKYVELLPREPVGQ